MERRIALVASLLCGLACEEKPPGRRLASGIAQRLVAHDGAVAFLLDASHPDDRAVPDDLRAGDLWAAPPDGPARKAGSGVSSQPGMYAFSAKGQIAFLASWRFRAGEGELWIAAPGAEAVQVAPAVREFAWSPSGASLAFVAPNQIGIRTGGASRLVSIGGLQNIAWAPDGKQVAARAAASSGGRLLLVDPETGALREIASGTSDFAFAPDGALAALGPPSPQGGDRPLLLDGKEIARATAFAFSPDGRELALLSTAKQPGEATGELYRLPRSGGEPKLLGQKVSDWRWGASGDLLFLSRYDLRARAGALTVSTPDALPRELAQKVQSFTAQGRRVLFLVQAPQKGDFKIELWGVDLAAAAAPHKIDEGVYGWDLVGDTLFYKARCAGGPRSCSLLRTRFATGAPPTFLSANVAGFDLSQDGSRILVQQPHRGATRAVDLALILTQGPPPEHVKPFVEETDSSSLFADPQGKRIAYAVIAAGKGGVFVTDVP
jgi:hypothetical protein